MTIVYIDLETNINNRGEDAIGSHQASPFHPKNEIVWTGYRFDMWEEDEAVACLRSNAVNFVGSNPPITMLVAQNIAFDLLHLLNSPLGQKWKEWCKTGQIWDVMLAEYLLTGQELKWASLDELSMIYGGTIKDSRMKEYWNNGIDTEGIPDEEIVPYLEQDVLNLEIIYKQQLKLAKKMGMLPLIESQMEARLATIMMENNGMRFNKHTAYREKMKLQVVYDRLELELNKWLVEEARAQSSVTVVEEDVNANSNKQLAAVLFGGSFTVKRDYPVLDEHGKCIQYKTGARKGQVKTKKTDVEVVCKGIYKSRKPPSKTGIYPVGDEALKAIGGGVIDKILQLREYNKQIGTYFDGYSRLVWPDNLIHGQLNHCQTNTGRLSSSKPNLQNISNKSSEGDEE